MALAPDVRRLIDRLGEGTPLPELGPAKAREEYCARIRELAGPAPVARGAPGFCAAEDTELAGVPVRVYRPVDANGPAAPGVVFFHGGGWVIGDLDTHDMHSRAIAVATNAVVVSVAYRRAPEHPYPAPLDDCWRSPNTWRATPPTWASTAPGWPSRETAPAGTSPRP